MLPESYFNGERLKAYLALLDRIKSESVDNVYKDVESSPIVVVTYDSVPPMSDVINPFTTIVTPLQDVVPVIVTEKKEELQYEVDFTSSSESSTVVFVCNDNETIRSCVKYGSEYMTAELIHNTIVRLKNGSWSKEIVTKKMCVVFRNRKRTKGRIKFGKDFFPLHKDIRQFVWNIYFQLVGIKNGCLQDISLRYGFEDPHLKISRDKTYYMVNWNPRGIRLKIISFDGFIYLLIGGGLCFKHSTKRQDKSSFVVDAYHYDDKFVLVDINSDKDYYQIRRPELDQVAMLLQFLDIKCETVGYSSLGSNVKLTFFEGGLLFYNTKFDRSIGMIFGVQVCPILLVENGFVYFPRREQRNILGKCYSEALDGYYRCQRLNENVWMPYKRVFGYQYGHTRKLDVVLSVPPMYRISDLVVMRTLANVSGVVCRTCKCVDCLPVKESN